MKKILMMAIFALASNAMAMSAGTYEQKLGDGSTEVLVVNQDGSMSLELTRQVGGPGGLTNEGVVPYETVCRVKQWGKIVSETSTYADYQVKFVHITDLTGLNKTENCERYVGEFNGRALTGSVRFSIIKSEYTKK